VEESKPQNCDINTMVDMFHSFYSKKITN